MALIAIGTGVHVRAQKKDAVPPAGLTQEEPADVDWINGVQAGMIRLPIAAALGTALALRPRRRGTPTRTLAVVQTQIILSVVGAVIMLVVGASLARAFGIVGAANLIRYRSKIDDPKDAVVMLCTLAIGLATGVGLFGLAGFSTIFLIGALWIIESFEPRARKFDLKIKIPGGDTDSLRPRIEPILSRYDLTYELRSAEQELSYEVRLPMNRATDTVTKGILSTAHGTSVEWTEQKKKGADEA